MTNLATILVSGGMDSLTCVAIAAAADHELQMLHLNYGQRTEERELKAFHDIAEFYNVPAEKRLVVDIRHMKQIGGSSLTDPDMPVTEPDLENEGIPTSYVPFRNAHILAVAVSWSEVTGASWIFQGAVEEDSSGYPDCRPAYYEAYNRVIAIGTKPETNIEIVTPVIHMKKSAIIERAVTLDAPLVLSWSCYQSNGPLACGNCDSCAIRLRGFREAGIRDPIPYEDEQVRDMF